MSFEDDFLDLMPATVTITTSAARSVYGQPTWSSVGHSYDARVVVRQREIRLATGQTAMSACTVWIASTGTNISIADRISLPAGTLPSTAPPILLVESYPDEDGPHHYKLELGY